jgi:2-C-methyl-D-erythritol 4-phosphate cytidylyltransferase/2-C-methyl-D-erythritol 2,4-cyclodiphosphate synthase
LSTTSSDAGHSGDGNEPFADAIVVAAGSSTRMGGIDKLGAIVAGVPILAHALRAIAAAPEVRRILIVASDERIEAIAEADWLPGKAQALVSGGERRQDSVAIGFLQLLANLPSDGRQPEVVLVHDGARPLVPAALVSAVAQAARVHGAAIPVVPVRDTIKRVGSDGSVAGAGERSTLGAAQTPQGIRTELLRQAYARIPADGPETFTDEAALLQACSIPVHAVDGDPDNIKVTVPADLERVEAALGVARPAPRNGIGHDSHPFGPHEPLVLAGVEIPGAPRLHGHSDGDVALHAISDALLGAAGLGDLGRQFPAGPATPAGIASGEMLGAVAARLAAAGMHALAVDITIVGARPRLADHLDAMQRSIAALLGLDAAAVNVKASTGNLDGMEGAGRGISALAIATVGTDR